MGTDGLEIIDKQDSKVVYFEKRRIPLHQSKPLFWAVASGKGGVGRSFFTSSLGITLSRMGYRTLMVDCDTNGGALHSWLGTYQKDKCLSDYFSGIDVIENYYTSLGFEKLCLLAGDTCLWNCEESGVRNHTDLLTDLKVQPFDIVLFDLSSGHTETNTEILKSCDDIFLVTTPEPSSIEKNYRWIENYLLKIGLQEGDRKLLCDFHKMRKQKEASAHTLFEVRNFLEGLQKKKKQEGESSPLFGPIKLVINQTRNFEDERLGESIKSICNKFYFTEIQSLGSLQYDNAVWQSGRQRAPVITHQPFNPLVGQIQSLVKHLVDRTTQRAVV